MKRPNQHFCVGADAALGVVLVFDCEEDALVDGFDVEQAERAMAPTSRLARTQRGRWLGEKEVSGIVGTTSKDSRESDVLKRYMIKQIWRE